MKFVYYPVCLGDIICVQNHHYILVEYGYVHSDDDVVPYYCKLIPICDQHGSFIIGDKAITKNDIVFTRYIFIFIA